MCVSSTVKTCVPADFVARCEDDKHKVICNAKSQEEVVACKSGETCDKGVCSSSGGTACEPSGFKSRCVDATHMMICNSQKLEEKVACGDKEACNSQTGKCEPKGEEQDCVLADTKPKCAGDAAITACVDRDGNGVNGKLLTMNCAEGQACGSIDGHDVCMRAYNTCKACAADPQAKCIDKIYTVEGGKVVEKTAEDNTQVACINERVHTCLGDSDSGAEIYRCDASVNASCNADGIRCVSPGCETVTDQNKFQCTADAKKKKGCIPLVQTASNEVIIGFELDRPCEANEKCENKDAGQGKQVPVCVAQCTEASHQDTVRCVAGVVESCQSSGGAYSWVSTSQKTYCDAGRDALRVCTSKNKFIDLPCAKAGGKCSADKVSCELPACGGVEQTCQGEVVHSCASFTGYKGLVNYDCPKNYTGKTGFFGDGHYCGVFKLKLSGGGETPFAMCMDP